MTDVVGGLFPPPSLSAPGVVGGDAAVGGCGGTIPPTFIERAGRAVYGAECDSSCGGTIPPTFIERPYRLATTTPRLARLWGDYSPHLH